MASKLIFEYEIDGEKHSFELPCCPYHRITACKHNGRRCLFPMGEPPERCHVEGTSILNGMIRRVET